MGGTLCCAAQSGERTEAIAAQTAGEEGAMLWRPFAINFRVKDLLALECFARCISDRHPMFLRPPLVLTSFHSFYFLSSFFASSDMLFLCIKRVYVVFRDDPDASCRALLRNGE
jgi:hypothetical protein